MFQFSSFDMLWIAFKMSVIQQFFISLIISFIELLKVDSLYSLLKILQDFIGQHFQSFYILLQYYYNKK